MCKTSSKIFNPFFGGYWSQPGSTRLLEGSLWIRGFATCMKDLRASGSALISAGPSPHELRWSCRHDFWAFETYFTHGTQCVPSSTRLPHDEPIKNLYCSASAATTKQMFTNVASKEPLGPSDVSKPTRRGVTCDTLVPRECCCKLLRESIPRVFKAISDGAHHANPLYNMPFPPHPRECGRMWNADKLLQIL